VKYLGELELNKSKAELMRFLFLSGTTLSLEQERVIDQHKSLPLHTSYCNSFSKNKV